MNIEITNVVKELVDDFGKSYCVATVLSADVYLDAKAFGYFHAAWKNSEPSNLNLVVHVLTDNESTAAVIIEVNVNTGVVSIAEESTGYYDEEWCLQNNVIFKSDVNNYTKANLAVDVGKALLCIVPDIVKVLNRNA